MIQLEALLAEVSPELPCGPNLEYDPDFLSLEEAAHGRPEQQSGSSIVPPKEPEWADVRQRAEALLRRTKDLRPAVLLCRALTRTDGFDGLFAGLTLNQQLLSRYWDNVYPHVEQGGEQGDRDPTMRLNALGPLVDSDGLLRDVRGLFVVTSTAGRVSVRDLLVAQKKLQPVGNASAMTLEAVEGLIRDSAAVSPPPIDPAQQSLQVLNALDALLSEKVGAAGSLDLKSLKEALTAVVAICRSALGVADPTQQSASGEPGENRVPVTGMGEIRRREDAVNQLDKVCEFIQKSEPGHPAPLLIRRAQRLMAKSFLEIIEDLAPESLGQIQKIAGLEKK